MQIDELEGINEVRFSPKSFAAALETGAQRGVLVGYEFEVCVPYSKFANRRYKIDYNEEVLQAFRKNITLSSWKPFEQGGYSTVIYPEDFDRLFKLKDEFKPNNFINFEKAVERYEPSNYYRLFAHLFPATALHKIEDNWDHYFNYDPKKVYKFLTDIDEIEPGKFEDDYEKAARGLISPSLKNTFNVPVKVFTDYHEADKDMTTWYIEPDGSIEADDNDEGLEIVTPPIPAKDAISTLKNFYAMAKKLKLYTSKENGTGIHINVSIPEGIDILKLAVFLGDQYALQLFDRTESEYALSVIKSLTTASGVEPYNFKQDRRKKNKIFPDIPHGTTQLNVASIARIAKSLSSNHYASISDNGKYVSFRHAGGDYLNDYQDVVNIVGRFVQAMIIASDPESNKQEYIKKLTKLYGTPPARGDSLSAIMNRYRASYDFVKKNGLPIVTIDMYTKEFFSDAKKKSFLKQALSRLVSEDDIATYFDLVNITVKPGTENSRNEFYKARNLEWDEKRIKEVEKTPIRNFARLEILPKTTVTQFLKVPELAKIYQNIFYKYRSNEYFSSKGGVVIHSGNLPITDPRVSQYVRSSIDVYKRAMNPVAANESAEYPEAPIYYFSYGMLCDPSKMRGYELLGVGELKNFELKMYQFANVEQKFGSSVYGCLWQLDKNAIRKLDRVEGYPDLYDRRTYPVYLDGRKHVAEVYIMTPSTLNYAEGTYPNESYVKSVARGYINAGIPNSQLHDALKSSRENQLYR
jgi:gamma-glutamylcyclotransferase (GGCT)/AIG2-like uncharacterized protein YtfP